MSFGVAAWKIIVTIETSSISGVYKRKLNNNQNINLVPFKNGFNIEF